jgi:adenylate kinase
MADQFGLINVSVRELVKEKMKETADLSQIIKSSMVAGKRLPDEIVNTLIAERLESPDCKVNGWIIEGFPMNEAQYNLLKTMKVKPSCTIILE